MRVRRLRVFGVLALLMVIVLSLSGPAYATRIGHDKTLYSDDDLYVTDDATIGDDASVGGDLTVSGAATVGTTLGVTGVATLGSASITGGATVGTTLGVTGASTLASVGVTGAATVGTTLGVTGAATFDDVKVDGKLNIGSANTFTDTDTTPDVSAGTYWNSNTTPVTITDFDGAGLEVGDTITVVSKTVVTYDVTSSGIIGNGTDIETRTYYITKFIYDGDNWIVDNVRVNTI